MAHRREVARVKRRAYRDCDYWGAPVPAWGDPGARLLIVGLAPGAHGANRTGRMFTGDSSGDFLYPALHRAGFCNQPASKHRDDGLMLRDAWMTAALRCVPPQNRPNAAEAAQCRPYLAEELELLPRLQVVLALGGLAWNACLRTRVARGEVVPRPRPRFGHDSRVDFDDGLTLIGCYHPSRQNTQTGRLTEAMIDDVLANIGRVLESAS